MQNGFFKVFSFHCSLGTVSGSNDWPMIFEIRSFKMINLRISNKIVKSKMAKIWFICWKGQRWGGNRENQYIELILENLNYYIGCFLVGRLVIGKLIILFTSAFCIKKDNADRDVVWSLLSDSDYSKHKIFHLIEYKNHTIHSTGKFVACIHLCTLELIWNTNKEEKMCRGWLKMGKKLSFSFHNEWSISSVILIY